MVTAFFVYGTLRRGHSRQSLWPARPISIQAAVARGTLYGRYDYPALTAGDDPVLGELWDFAAADVPEVIAVLDRIEGTNQPGQADLYHRIVQEICDTAGTPLGQAYVYVYARDPIEDAFAKIQKSDDGQVQWLPVE